MSKNDLYLEELFQQIKTKAKNSAPHESYSAYLLNLGAESVGKKLIEEVFELAVANIELENFPKKRAAVIMEAADVMYHMMALLCSREIEFSEIVDELKKRNNKQNDTMISSEKKTISSDKKTKK
jgi:phosphoribosyl-ATP pyrophosphohydrolase